MPPMDPAVSHYVLNRRRHGISSGLTVEAVYQSEPRMNRRNAISYESDDAAAKYIRYLGVFWWLSFIQFIAVMGNNSVCVNRTCMWGSYGVTSQYV